MTHWKLNTMTANEVKRSCSFCGIEEVRAEHLFLGPGVAICDVCVETCRQPMDDPAHKTPEPEELANAISAGLGWGPLNCGTAIRANFCCEYCGKRMLRSVDNYYSWEVDHIIPGGEDSLDNYALACHTCNHLKHSYAPSGGSRSERLTDAVREIGRRRAKKIAELQNLRSLLGLPALIDA